MISAMIIIFLFNMIGGASILFGVSAWHKKQIGNAMILVATGLTIPTMVTLSVVGQLIAPLLPAG